MALRDWHGWQIGMMWGIGIALAWLVSRLGVRAVSPTPRASGDTLVAGDTLIAAGARVTAGGAPLWTTGVVLAIVTILLFITVRWVRASILDQ